MLVDLHAHYPMHLLDSEQRRAHEQASRWWRHRWQSWIVELISRVANYQGPGDTPSVTEELMRSGEVGVVASVLYAPFDEMDLSQDYGAPPRPGYFADIVDQRQTVEDHIAEHSGQVAVAHSAAELGALLAGPVPIVVHAIEGGLQAGADAAEIRDNVRRLGELGIAYITIAHLFFRAVATNAPALPFLPDWLYRRVFPQTPGVGLTELGRELVEAMVDEGILIDITHMRAEAIRDVFTLLDARDPANEIPVIASHMAYRFGALQYSFDDAIVRRVAQRGGVLGLILCEHYITNGLRGIDASPDGSLRALYRHIDKLAELTAGYDHIGIGSDLDGYIKPALPGLEHMGQMAGLQRGLRARYGTEAAEKICGGNALRVLQSEWGRKRPRPAAP